MQCARAKQMPGNELLQATLGSISRKFGMAALLLTCASSKYRAVLETAAL